MMMLFDEGTNSYLECCSLPKLYIQLFDKVALLIFVQKRNMLLM